MTSGPRDIRDIATLLGVDPRFAGSGLRFDIGALYPQTGPGAIFGERIGDVPNLACRHVLAMGGPTFNLIMRDNRTGDPSAGERAIEEFGAAGLPMMLSSLGGNLGGLLPAIERHEILTLDGSGGAPLFAQGKTFFWGSMAITPSDALPGAIAFVKTTMPAAAKFCAISWDLHGLDDEIALDVVSRLVGSGLAAGPSVKTAIGATDYSAALRTLANDPGDVIFCFLYGEDVGYFLKQYAEARIGKPVIAFTHSDAAREIAGAAYDGLIFAFDYFDAERPANPWAAFYIDEFREHAGLDFAPDQFGANTYEDIFTLWACIRRVLERGGDPRSGRALDAALRADPSFPSLYGGDANRAGTLRFDLATHSVAHRPMTIARVAGAKIVPLAYFESGRSVFELV